MKNEAAQMTAAIAAEIQTITMTVTLTVQEPHWAWSWFAVIVGLILALAGASLTTLAVVWAIIGASEYRSFKEKLAKALEAAKKATAVEQGLPPDALNATSTIHGLPPESEAAKENSSKEKGV